MTRLGRSELDFPDVFCDLCARAHELREPDLLRAEGVLPGRVHLLHGRHMRVCRRAVRVLSEAHVPAEDVRDGVLRSRTTRREVVQQRNSRRGYDRPSL